jgi:cobalamin biosynthesis protein CobT
MSTTTNISTEMTQRYVTRKRTNPTMSKMIDEDETESETEEDVDDDDPDYVDKEDEEEEDEEEEDEDEEEEEEDEEEEDEEEEEEDEEEEEEEKKVPKSKIPVSYLNTKTLFPHKKREAVDPASYFFSDTVNVAPKVSQENPEDEDNNNMKEC